MKREIRTFTAAQIRAAAPASEGDKRGMDGYAAVFNSAYDVKYPGYVFRETIKPGAFTRALKEKQDVRALINHDDNFVLGRTKSGTLELKQDDKGLHWNIPELPDTSAARDLHVSVQRGDIDQCSFAFIVRKQSRSEETMKDGTVVMTRMIEDVDLLDVSPVTYPAYEDTSCEARSLFPDGVPEELAEFRAQDPAGDDTFKERMELRLRLAEKA